MLLVGIVEKTPKWGSGVCQRGGKLNKLLVLEGGTGKRRGVVEKGVMLSRWPSWTKYRVVPGGSVLYRKGGGPGGEYSVNR